MRVDIGNALDTVADPGLSESDLAEVDERVAEAHERIDRGMADGEFGYEALNLPDRVDADEIYGAVEGFDPEAVLTVGIGGSALGAVTLTTALGADSDVEHYALDNVDPARANRLLDALPLEETVVHAVSKSGTTAETLGNFLVVRDAMESAGADWTEQTLVTTGEAGPLRALADEHGLPALDVPEGVPGRFSVLSSVGLVPAAIQGVDLDAVLAGAEGGADALAGSLYDCPAYAFGAVSHALDRRGATINAMMPYAESLEPFAEWFAQLWAESLGKDGGGQTPMRALGATDQHSQLQLYRAGRRDKLVTFVRPRERPEAPIPETDIDPLAYLGGRDLGTLLDTEFEATEASLAAASRPNVRVEIPRVDAESVGRLLYDVEAACVLAGELADVETFTQPAVEWGKNATRGLLGGEDAEEAEAVRDKTELVVE
ncbi:MAG: glucose-6-phosphate isomerase [Haloarculaceae archaeon]